MEIEDEQMRDFLIRSGAFPLHGIEAQFGDIEAEFIQTAYQLFLMENKDHYEDGSMPPAFVGTAAELWCIIQIFWWADTEYNLDRLCQTLFPQMARNPQVIAELKSFGTRKSIHLGAITRSIFSQICRRMDPTTLAGDASFHLIHFASDPIQKMRVAQAILPMVREYGQYPIQSPRIAYAQLSDIEQDAVSLSYLCIIWNSAVKGVEFVMPAPAGTPMEIWCILNIVAAYIPLIGRMRDNFNAKHVLSVLYDERYLGRRLSGYLEWLDQEIPSIARKISAGRYERYLICEDYRERRNMVFRVGRDQLHSDARHLVKQAYLKEYHASHPTMQACYEDVYRSTKPRWKPFQYWLDEASGLWRVSRLPLSAN